MDVTAGKALETQLRERIAIFNEAADATDFCVFGRNQVDGPYQWSDQVWAIHGLPRRETQPAAGELRALIHPADVARWEAEIAALRADPRRLLGEVGWRIVRPDGSTRHLVATIRYERDAAGVARTQRGILRDVTERRAADEARAASEAWLLEAAEGAEVGLFDRDLISGRAFWSPRNWEIFGVAPEGEAPSYERNMAIGHPDDRAEWGRVVSALPGAPGAGGIVRGFRIVRGDGAVRHLVSRSKVLRDAGGRAVRNRGIIMDVTERRGAVEALHAEKERFRHAAEVAEMGVFERDMVTGVRTWWVGAARAGAERGGGVFVSASGGPAHRGGGARAADGGRQFGQGIGGVSDRAAGWVGAAFGRERAGVARCRGTAGADSRCGAGYHRGARHAREGDDRGEHGHARADGDGHRA